MIYFTGIEWGTDFLDEVKFNACRGLHNIDILQKFVITYALYHKIRIIFQIFVGIFERATFILEGWTKRYRYSLMTHSYLDNVKSVTI